MIYKDGVISSQTISRSIAISYIVNIVAPFRIGEIVRTVYLKKSGFNFTASIFAITVERIIDSVMLLLFYSLYIAIIDNVFQTYFLATLLTLLVIISVTLYIFKSEKIKMLILSIFSNDVQVRMHLAILQIFLSLKKLRINFQQIALYSLAINSSIFISILLFSNAFKVNLISLSNPLLFDLSNSIYQTAITMFQLSINKFAILSFLLMPILVLLLPSSRYWNSTNLTLADVDVAKFRHSIIPESRTQVGDSFIKDMIGAIVSSKDNHLTIIQREILSDSRVSEVFKGGASGDLVFLLNSDGKPFVRKSALGERRAFLKNQNEWMIEMTNYLPLVSVKELVETENATYFDMEYIGPDSSFFEWLHRSDLSISIIRLDELIEKLNITNVVADSPTEDCRSKYLDRYDKKVRSCFAASTSKGSDRYLSQPFEMNSRKVLPISLEAILNFLSLEDLPQPRPCIVHGDLTVSNMLTIQSGDIRLIDPNPNQPFNHPTVDLGKLLQSFKCGFEFNFDNQRLLEDGEIVKISDMRSHIYVTLEQHIYSLLISQGKESEIRHANIQLLLHLLRIIPYAKKANQVAWVILQARIIYTELVADSLSTD